MIDKNNLPKFKKKILIKAYPVKALSKPTGCLILKVSHQSSRRLHLILTSISNNLRLLVCLAHLVNNSSFHYNKPCCNANIDIFLVTDRPLFHID